MGGRRNASRDFWRGRAAVYRLYADDGQLLYVGLSEDVCSRLAAHRNQTPWYGDVARIVIKLAPDRRVAFATEAAAIRAEKPLYNIRYGVGWIEPRARRKAA